MKRLYLILTLLLFSFPAFGQQQVITQPYGSRSSNNSGTIAVTNTFQSVFTASTGNNTGRTGCALQNNSASNSMYVFFGAIADATIGKSVKLSPGQSVNCNAGNIVLKDEVSITGTSGDAFFAAQQ